MTLQPSGLRYKFAVANHVHICSQHSIETKLKTRIAINNMAYGEANYCGRCHRPGEFHYQQYSFLTQHMGLDHSVAWCQSCLIRVKFNIAKQAYRDAQINLDELSWFASEEDVQRVRLALESAKDEYDAAKREYERWFGFV